MSKLSRQNKELQRLRSMSDENSDQLADEVTPRSAVAATPTTTGGTITDTVVEDAEVSTDYRERTSDWRANLVELFVHRGRLRLREIAVVVLIASAGWIAFQDNNENRLEDIDGLLAWGNKVIGLLIAVALLVIVYHAQVALEQWWSARNQSRTDAGLRWLIKVGPIRLTSQHVGLLACLIAGSGLTLGITWFLLGWRP